MDYVSRSIRDMGYSERKNEDALQESVEQRLGIDIGKDAATIVLQMYKARDPPTLVRAVRMLGWNETTESNEELFNKMSEIDINIEDGLASRDVKASKVSRKKSREDVYIPRLIEMAEGGDIYMAKTLTSEVKVMLARELNPNNQIVVVDDYDHWESLLGWKKLKELPSGKNKVTEQYGDKLSDDVLDEMFPKVSKNSTSKSRSGGRKPKKSAGERELNVALGSSQRKRDKIVASDIKDMFENKGKISSWGITADRLVLFPSDTDKNMTDYWWITGTHGYIKAAIANCTKGVYDYLSHLPQVYHIDDYMNKSDEVVINTNKGRKKLGDINLDNHVLIIVHEDNEDWYRGEGVIDNIPGVLEDHVNSYKNRRGYDVNLPDEDDMVFSVVTPSSMFPALPFYRMNVTKRYKVADNNGQDDGPVVIYGDASSKLSHRGVYIRNDAGLYVSARLSEWDTDEPVVQSLHHISDRAGERDEFMSLLETVGMLHDMGLPPKSYNGGV